MTIDEIFSRTDSMLSQYDSLRQERFDLYQRMNDAEREYDACVDSLSGEEDPAASQRIQSRMRAAAQEMQRCQQRVGVVEREIGECQGILLQARSLIEGAVVKLQAEMDKVDKTIGAFSALSQRGFGSGEAAAQIPGMQRKRDTYQDYFNRGHDYLARIDRALNGAGTQPDLVYRRR